MILPNKVISFSDSIIGKMPIILKKLSYKECLIHELYIATEERFDGVEEFIYALDVLYLLDAITVDFEKGVVKYADKD